MYKQSRAVSAAVLAVACAACARHSVGPQLALRPSEAKWSGPILTKDQHTGAVEASRRTNMNGQVTMIADPDFPNRTRVDLSLGTPTTNSTVLWSIAADRCGTGGVPVLPVNAFPPLEIGPSGRGQVTAVIPFELPTQGSYHVDIYQGRRATLSDVQACAELKMTAR
jgi:hypothetical protein